MVNSDSFGHLPLAGGEEEANDFLRDKWEAHRRTSLDAANREKEVRSVVAAAGLSGVKSGDIYSVASGGKSGSGGTVFGSAEPGRGTCRSFLSSFRNSTDLYGSRTHVLCKK